MKIRKALPLQVIVFFVVAASLWIMPWSGVTAAPPHQGADIAIISSPASNAVIQGVVQITGSADHPSFQFYVVDIAPEPHANDQWGTIGATHGSAVVNGVLETWDTTQVPDGSYSIRLRVVRLDGNYSEYFTQQVVVSNTQVVPTNTPVAETPLDTAPAAPTVTPTALPPTPTIVIEQPVVATPTPRVVPTSAPLANPDEEQSVIPTVTGFSFVPLNDACLYGAGIMLGVFLLFGFLGALRMFVQGFIDRLKRKR